MEVAVVTAIRATVSGRLPTPPPADAHRGREECHDIDNE
jgi:hypothetical protein